MRLLLDTNIIVPIVDRRGDELPSAISAIVNDPAHQRFISAVALWEIAIKARIGKLQIGPNPADIPLMTQQLGLLPLDITFAHAIAEVDPEPLTRDPFDRLLLAQCAVESMRLVTLDRALAAHPLAWR